MFPKLSALSTPCLAAGLLLGGAPLAAQATPPASLAAVNSETLLLYSAELDGISLTDSLATYGDPEDPLLPIGELSRLLDLDVSIRPDDGTVTGRIGESQRRLLIDPQNAIAQIGGRTLRLLPDDIARGANDIYLKAGVLQVILPLTIAINPDELVLQLKSTEKLPLQARRERMAKRAAQSLFADAYGPTEEQQIRVSSPYEVLDLPAFDFSSNIGLDSTRPGLIRRFEGRVAGDLLKATFNGFAATDDRGAPSVARAMLYRHSPSGDLLGPIGATYAAGGDVFTPALALGPRSIGGAGFAFSTAKQEEANVFDRITLRGELPLGYDVEIYINDILRSGQDTPVKGRYEFVDVPLVRGMNVIRIVAYGPRGERQEQVRVINVGGGQLARGELTIDAGLVAQERSIFEFASARQGIASPARGGLRGVLSAAYGISTEATVNLGLASFRNSSGEQKRIATAGLRTSLLGTALQLDVAQDFSSGIAASLSAAGRLGPIYFVSRHIEFGSGFEDENLPYFDVSRPTRRYSQVSLDLAAPMVWVKQLPISFRIERNEYVDGDIDWASRAGTSLTIADTVTALGVTYSRRERAGVASQQMSINLSASRLVDYAWQLRASADYDVLPKSRLRGMALTADKQISEDVGFRLGLAKSFGEFNDLTAQAGLNARTKLGDIAISGDYSPNQNRWRIGLQFSVGLGFDPVRKNYRLTPPGPANGGSAVIQAFVDDNGNGKFDESEKPIEGIKIGGAMRPTSTDAAGNALVTGLGDGKPIRLTVDPSVFDNTFAASPPRNIVLVPRAGKVASIPYPITPTAEVYFQLQIRTDDGAKVGVAAVQVQLIPETGEPISGSSEFDGGVAFESIRPGRYRLQLDPTQAARLRMRLKQDVEIQVKSGFLNRVVDLEFVREA